MKNEQEKTEWMQKPVVVWLGAMLCCFLWGSAFPCIKIGYKLWEINSLDTASQILFAGMRFLLAGILAIVLGSMLERRFLKPEQGAAGKILWLSLLQTVAQYMFFYIGLAHTSGVKASIIEAVNVFVAILVSGCLFRQETIHARQMIGCLIGFAGVVLINLNGVDFHMQANGEGFIDDCLRIFIRVPEAIFCKAQSGDAFRLSVHRGWHYFDPVWSAAWRTDGCSIGIRHRNSCVSGICVRRCLFALGTALKIQSGIKGGGVRIHESGVRCDLIRMVVG